MYVAKTVELCCERETEIFNILYMLCKVQNVLKNNISYCKVLSLMCVIGDLLLLGHDLASTGIRTQTFRDHTLSRPFLGIMDPVRSNHDF